MPPEPRRWQTAVADAMACEAEATVASHVPRPSVPHSAQLGVGWERSRDNGLTLLRDLEALAAELELELEPELGPELEPEPEPEPNGPRGVAVAILDAPEFAVQLSAPSSNVQRTSRSAGVWPDPEHELEPEPQLEVEPELEPNGPGGGVAVATLDAPEFATQLSAPSSNMQSTNRSGVWPDPEHELELELEPMPGVGVIVRPVADAVAERQVELEPEPEPEHELEPEPEPAHLLQRQPQPQPESTDVPHRLACKTDVDATLTTVVSLRGGLYYEYRLHVDRATANIIIG